MTSIPELRRSFEHIEEFVDDKIAQHCTKDVLRADLRKEWRQVFSKTLDASSADAFIEDRMKYRNRRGTKRGTRRQGGGAVLAGAPLDYQTRAGIYLAPGQIPDARGHLPLSSGAPSTYGSYVQYVDKGFWNPEIAQSYDPVAGQPKWPVVPAGMGSNAVRGGSRGRSRKQRKLRRGGASLVDSMGSFFSQLGTRPFPAQAPPGIAQDMQSMMNGSRVGPSPDQVQRQVQYNLGTKYPAVIDPLVFK